MTLAQDENTRQQLFDQGQIDVLTDINAEYLDQKQSEVDAGDIQLVSGPQPRNSYICFNNEDPNGDSQMKRSEKHSRLHLTVKHMQHRYSTATNRHTARSRLEQQSEQKNSVISIRNR